MTKKTMMKKMNISVMKMMTNRRSLRLAVGRQGQEERPVAVERQGPEDRLAVAAAEVVVIVVAAVAVVAVGRDQFTQQTTEDREASVFMSTDLPDHHATPLKLSTRLQQNPLDSVIEEAQCLTTSQCKTQTLSP